MRGVRTKFKVGDEVCYNHWDEISLMKVAIKDQKRIIKQQTKILEEMDKK